jgi:serine/threonine protein kinase
MAAYFIKQVIEAMINIHTNGYIHRDLKPENLFVSLNKIKIGYYFYHHYYYHYYYHFYYHYYYHYYYHFYYYYYYHFYFEYNNNDNYIGDFGLAIENPNEWEDKRNTFCGTLDYISPEMFKK